LIVLVVAMVLTAMWGWAIERMAYRRLRGSFRLAPLISAIGVSIFLANFVQVVQGARNKPTPPMVRDVIVLWTGDNGYAVALSPQADHHHGRDRPCCSRSSGTWSRRRRSAEPSGPASRTGAWPRCSASTSTAPSR
jgi:hypothetical protein